MFEPRSARARRSPCRGKPVHRDRLGPMSAAKSPPPDPMTTPYSWKFRKKRIHRLTRTLPPRSVAPRVDEQDWSRGVRAAPLKGVPSQRVEQKVPDVTEVTPLDIFPKPQAVRRVDHESPRLPGQQGARASVATSRHLRKLNRAQARQQLTQGEGVAASMGEHGHAAAKRQGRPAPQSPAQRGTLDTHEEMQAPGLAGSLEHGRNARRRTRAGGRRKYHPSIPPHIDQSRLPQGLYWNNTGAGRWCMLVTDPQTGARHYKVVAGRNARLSVLRALVGARSRDTIRGSLGWVMARFAESPEFAELSPSTQANYTYCANVARAYKTQNARGPSLDTLYVDRLRLPAIQHVIETIGRGRRESQPGAGDALPAYPAKANRLLRYLHRLFNWGMRHGHCKTNPAAGARRLRERARSGMPSRIAYDAVLQFAQARGALTPHAPGSLAPYLWPLMEIKYLCRMRSPEVLQLTDAHASEQGLYVARRKRSYDNIVRWSPRLRAAWNAALAVRATIRARTSNKTRLMPSPERRFIFVTETLNPLSVAALLAA